MLLTPLIQLRKEAPGSLTRLKIAQFFRKNRFPRSHHTIGDFERGEYLNPPDRFIELYAECIRQPRKRVEEAYRLTRRMREKKSGPFRE